MPDVSNPAPDLAPFVPRLVRAWLADDSVATHRTVEGTLAFIDISGFTQLTERLTARGKVGAEELSEVLDALFSELLELARRDGAHLLKWGGDAVLLLFEGEQHAAHAARAAFRMRARLHRFGKVRTGAGAVRLGMSVGIHSGEMTFFLVGDPSVHRELIVCGPTATRTAQLEAAASRDEIFLSPQAVSHLGRDRVVQTGSAFLLVDEPHLADSAIETEQVRAADADLTSVISPPIREYLLANEFSAEHRRVAVGFVRFSGTDAMLASDGADVLGAALDECVQIVQHATQRHGVTFLESDIDQDGGKIMIVSGAPRSGDHDEDRLLRTARQIITASAPLPIQLGLNRGAVFTGVLGPSFCRTYSVKGDAVNVAARITGRAHPGEALATSATLTHANAQFEHHPLPAICVKGKAAPIDITRLGVAVHECTRQAEEAGVLLAREVELAALRAAHDEAGAGIGALVEVVGEPGIGKSRLVYALLAEIDTPSFVVSCDEYETTTPYWPFRVLFDVVLRLPSGARDAGALRDAVRRHEPTLLPWLPLLGRVLDVDVPSTPEVDALDERFRQARMQDVAVEFLAAALPAQVVVVLEDVHLMDAASAGLLDRLSRNVHGRSWLIVVTRRDVSDGFRPEGAKVSIRPAPLDNAAALQLAQTMGADRTLTGSAIESLAARAGGNPLFLRGLIAAAATGHVAALPDTVEALITSQLDRLPARERTALRFASVLGMRFERSELRTLLGTRGLPCDAEAVRRMDPFLHDDHGALRFAHQLVRDTAYETLPFRVRRSLHGSAGDLLERRAANPDEIAEILSLHFTHAERHDKAWQYSRIGGERAAEKYAYVQAEELFARAVQAARQTPGIAAEDVVAANISLGDARFKIGRQLDAVEPYRAARRALSDDPSRAALLLRREAEIDCRVGRLSVGLGKLTRGLRLLGEDDSYRAARSRIESFYAQIRQTQGRYRDALSWARQADEHARRSNDPAAQAEALQAVLSALAFLGDTSHESYAREAIELYKRIGDRAGQSRAVNNLAMLAWFDGRGLEALEMFREARDLATEAGDAVKAAVAEYNVTDVLLRLGHAEQAEMQSRALLPVLRSLGLEDYVAGASRALGTATALAGHPREGDDLLHRARERLEELGEPAEVLETDACIVWTKLERGDSQQAEAIASQAVQRAEELGAVELLAWLLRLQGAALADLGRPDAARSVLSRALDLASAHCRVDLGFVLVELSRLAPPDQAADLRRRAEDAFNRLGYVGTRRDPRRPLTSS